MESKAREALYHLVLNSMSQLLKRGEFEAWVDGEIELAPLFRPMFETVPSQRDTLLRELHQMFPAEVLDRFIEAHPEVDVGDKTSTIVRIGRELQAIKDIVQSL